MTDPRAMKTDGVGQFCDWLNHDVSMADDPEIKQAAARGEKPPTDWRKPVLNGREVTPAQIGGLRP